jgi:hypothetical protein
VQRVEAVDGGGVVVGPLACSPPVAHDEADVEEPALDGPLRCLDALDGAVREADRGEAGDAREALLRAGVDGVASQPSTSTGMPPSEVTVSTMRRPRARAIRTERAGVGAGAGGGLGVDEGEHAFASGCALKAASTFSA